MAIFTRSSSQPQVPAPTPNDTVAAPDTQPSTDEQPPQPRKRKNIAQRVLTALQKAVVRKAKENTPISGSGPVQCDICKKLISRKADMPRHKRTHTDERWYPCHYCDYRATQSYRLTVHERRHTGEKPEICQFCGVAYMDPSQLSRHLKAEHHHRRGPRARGKNAATTTTTPARPTDGMDQDEDADAEAETDHEEEVGRTANNLNDPSLPWLSQERGPASSPSASSPTTTDSDRSLLTPFDNLCISSPTSTSASASGSGSGSNSGSGSVSPPAPRTPSSSSARAPPSTPITADTNVAHYVRPPTPDWITKSRQSSSVSPPPSSSSTMDACAYAPPGLGEWAESRMAAYRENVEYSLSSNLNVVTPEYHEQTEFAYLPSRYRRSAARDECQ